MWRSPIASESFREYRDAAAVRALGLRRPHSATSAVLASEICCWDALGVTSSGRPLLLEAKAHIPEAASPGTKATPKSRALIERSLESARRHYAPKSSASWSGHFYQYANRLAHQFWFRTKNGVPSSLVFLYFTNAVDMDGPATEEEWRGAEHLIHRSIGLPADLSRFGVHGVS